jgi:hypothetical protein
MVLICQERERLMREWIAAANHYAKASTDVYIGTVFACTASELAGAADSSRSCGRSEKERNGDDQDVFRANESM